MKKYIWLIGLFLFPILAQANNAKLMKVQVNAADHAVHITLSLTQFIPFQTFLLANPSRLVVDLPHTQLATSLKNINLDRTGIHNIRIGYPSKNMTRMVFDLKNLAPFKMSAQQKANQITLHLATNLSFKPPKKNIKLTSAFHPVTPLVAKMSLASRPLIIAIDAGHGGHDPGAIGAHGIKEKNITLAIAKRLAYLINQQSNMRAVLTRRGDYYVGLRERLQLARNNNADFFIALHADSYFNDRANGASVYALSSHGATSEAARWLARRDNYSELGGVDLRELSDQSYLLRSVLIDLAQTATITDSLRLGKIILSQLHQVTRLHYRYVEQAPFMVLKSPDIPSILVEMGFVSNTKEALRLNSEAYQNELAQALFKSTDFYLQKYPVNPIS